MSEKRRDKKGRILRNGECQRKDGMYQFDYVDLNGKPKCVYSWKLEPTDPLPKGKRKCLSLREKEKEIQKAIDNNIIPCGGSYTMLELLKLYIQRGGKLKISTKETYRYTINAIENEYLLNKRIDKIRTMDAKQWCLELERVGKAYGTISVIKGLAFSAFQMAVEEDLLIKNPFEFSLAKTLKTKKPRRKAIASLEQAKFLEFVKNNTCYKKYYDVMYVLFATGIRNSELCGLTEYDIDFNARILHISKQLRRISGVGYVVMPPKSDCGVRDLPITDEVCECFKRIIANRRVPKIQPVVLDLEGNEHSEFIFLSNRGNPMEAHNWDHIIKNIIKRYNKENEIPLPKITPHICRHTYSTNYAAQTKGMNPKHLQYLMGHADITTTMNIYTDVDEKYIRQDIESVRIN